MLAQNAFKNIEQQQQQQLQQRKKLQRNGKMCASINTSEKKSGHLHRMNRAVCSTRNENLRTLLKYIRKPRDTHATVYLSKTENPNRCDRKCSMCVRCDPKPNRMKNKQKRAQHPKGRKKEKIDEIVNAVELMSSKMASVSLGFSFPIDRE